MRSRRKMSDFGAIRRHNQNFRLDIPRRSFVLRRRLDRIVRAISIIITNFAFQIKRENPLDNLVYLLQSKYEGVICMAKKYKQSSPWVLIIPLIIAIIVVLSAAVLSQKTAYTRSKASYNPTQACINACNADYKQSVIKNPAACALDCPDVASREMSCKDFCKENVKPIVAQGANNTISSMEVCVEQCRSWIGNPCTAEGAVCKIATGKNKSAAKSQCARSCNLVNDDVYTCNEVMTTASLSAVAAQIVPMVRNNCIKYFE